VFSNDLWELRASHATARKLRSSVKSHRTRKNPWKIQRIHRWQVFLAYISPSICLVPFVAIGGEIAGGLGSFQYGGIVDSPLGHDEVPIIAHRGEAIIPASQVRAGALGGGPRVYQQFTIQTPHANSFRAAQSHIMADAHKQALAAIRKS
jgi:hypothetical protein